MNFLMCPHVGRYYFFYCKISTKRRFKNNFLDFRESNIDLLKTMNREHYHQKALEPKDFCISNFTMKEENCDDGLYVGSACLAYALWYMSTNETFKSQRENLLSDAKSSLVYLICHS